MHADRGCQYGVHAINFEMAVISCIVILRGRNVMHADGDCYGMHAIEGAGMVLEDGRSYGMPCTLTEAVV
jgi:hypothetical protein